MPSSASSANSGYDSSRFDHHHCNDMSVLYAMSTLLGLGLRLGLGLAYFASSVAISPLRLLIVAVDDDSKASVKKLNIFIAGGAHLPGLQSV